MTNFFKNKILAIALFSLRIPAIYFVILIYSLFIVYYNYKLGYSFFCLFQIVKCSGSESINSNGGSQNFNSISEISKQVSKELIKNGITVNHRLEINYSLKTAAEIFKESLKYYVPGLLLQVLVG
jgi:hypothetical protein